MLLQIFFIDKVMEYIYSLGHDENAHLVICTLLFQVQHVRNIESHFLSAQECIMAGNFQNLHPNPCRFSPGGYFGSKFATVCVTGKNL